VINNAYWGKPQLPNLQTIIQSLKTMYYYSEQEEKADWLDNNANFIKFVGKMQKGQVT
jgi:hypothetical protein